MIRELSKTYTGRDGAPTIARVDVDIFTQRYFMQCMECTFCHDICCQYGADIDPENLERLEPYTEALEAFTHIPRSEWFTGVYEDAEYPGGRSTRTTVRNGACVFLNRQGRGCQIHSFSLKNGVDYHVLKPLVCWLFPIYFHEGLLHPSPEIQEGSLMCMNTGPTLYQAARSEIEYLFGAGLVAELDAMEIPAP